MHFISNILECISQVNETYPKSSIGGHLNGAKSTRREPVHAELSRAVARRVIP